MTTNGKSIPVVIDLTKSPPNQLRQVEPQTLPKTPPQTQPHLRAKVPGSVPSNKRKTPPKPDVVGIHGKREKTDPSPIIHHADRSNGSSSSSADFQKHLPAAFNTGSCEVCLTEPCAGTSPYMPVNCIRMCLACWLTFQDTLLLRDWDLTDPNAPRVPCPCKKRGCTVVTRLPSSIVGYIQSCISQSRTPPKSTYERIARRVLDARSLGCPYCSTPYVDFEGCLVVQCDSCSERFCVCCHEKLQGSSSDQHAHCTSCSHKLAAFSPKASCELPPNEVQCLTHPNSCWPRVCDDLQALARAHRVRSIRKLLEPLSEAERKAVKQLVLDMDPSDADLWEHAFDLTRPPLPGIPN
jgi:hypothetical protein